MVQNMWAVMTKSPMLADFLGIGDALSKFADSLIQRILKSLYSGLYNSCDSTFDGLFDDLNKRVEDAAETLTKTPQGWNDTAYDMVKNVAENAFLPIAAVIITIIFCWELVRMVQDSNSMQQIKPERIMLTLLKLGMCLLVCSKAFDIVMAFFDLGAEATSKISGSTVGTFGEGLTFSDLVTPTDEMTEFEFGDIMTLLWYLLILWIGRILIIATGCIIYIRCVLWFLELLIYSSAASIPYATWVNKDWSQVGMNYTRKMLSLAFQGPFMLLLFAIYGGVISGIQADDFTVSMVMIIGCGLALCMMMFKVSTISDSIFNAH